MTSKSQSSISYCWTDWWNVAIELIFCRMLFLRDIQYNSQDSSISTINSFFKRFCDWPGCSSKYKNWFHSSFKSVFFHITSRLFKAGHVLPNVMSVMSMQCQCLFRDDFDVLISQGFDSSEWCWLWHRVFFELMSSPTSLPASSRYCGICEMVWKKS